MPTKALELMKGNIYSTHEHTLGSNITGCTLDFDSLKQSDIHVHNLGHLIKEVIFNDPYTIINWKSGTKTIVKAQDGDEFNKEKGLLLAIVKYLNGNGGNYNEIIKEWC
jgi:hypothetical protein